MRAGSRPDPVLPLLLVAALAGCGAGSALGTTISKPSVDPAPDAFACVRDQLKAGNWAQTSLDSDELRVTGRKYDEDVRRPDATFRRLVHRLSFDVDPGTGGAVTDITVAAATFAEYTTQRGPTEVQEKTAESVRLAADSIVTRCSAPVDSTKVPG